MELLWSSAGLLGLCSGFAMLSCWREGSANTRPRTFTDTHLVSWERAPSQEGAAP